MARKHGSKAKVYVEGYDLTGYLRQVSSAGSADVAETTTLGKTAKTYIPGPKDAVISAEGLYDGDADAVDEVLQEALGKEETIWTWYPQGDAHGEAGYGAACVETSYEIETPVDDVAAITAEAQADGGRDRIQSYHALAEETASGQSSSIDNGAATNNGGVAYLHVPALTGTGPTLDVTIQHSADNGATDPWSALVTFTQVTVAHSVERKEVAGTVKRYTRAVWNLGGTGPAATFNVAFGRK